MSNAKSCLVTAKQMMRRIRDHVPYSSGAKMMLGAAADRCPICTLPQVEFLFGRRDLVQNVRIMAAVSQFPWRRIKQRAKEISRQIRGMALAGGIP